METQTHWTIESIETAVTEAGSHWFEESTLRFFRSRIGWQVYQGPGGVHFVSSEKRQGFGCDDGDRLFTVRRFNPDNPGSVETVGDFQQYRSRSGAHAAARRASA